MEENTNIEKIHCSFCGKEITGIVAIGNDAAICPECTVLANKMYVENKEEANKQYITDIPKPKEIKAFLDQYVIGQELAKERIAVAVYNHYKRISAQITDVEIDKSNVILCGSTGSGKTYIAKTVAKMLNVPFAICDATVITQAGYVGEDIESILTRLLQAADYDVERAEKGIVFIDEIDKIGRKSDNPSITRDVGGEGVQQGLLKLLEGSVVNVPPQGGRKHPEQKMIPVDTKNILFICGGAFEGIERKIASRTNKRVIGYQAETDNKNKKEDKKSLLAKVTHEDLRSFGMIPEILGRLPILTYLDELDKKAIRNILTEPKNALVKQYEALLAIDGIKLSFSESALDYIADKAIERKLGARGLRGIMEDLMNKAMFEMPSSDSKELHIDKKYCKKYLE
jgi:ATP-dependent Clp protease ATP-binding subunit ClpX